jgi:carbon-monoxide dehydrogenase small subunit
MEITLTINGEKMTCPIEPGERLLDTLRARGYLGVKKGCGEGTCGTCSVILDGRLVTSCLVFSAAAEGARVTTIEGLGDPNHPHVIQQEFVKAGAVQCGFCTPGMVLATKALLDARPDPTEDDIRVALDGNLCRCTGYVKIIEAVKSSAAALAGKAAAPKGGSHE